jgi:soluble cytochrome b562
MRRFLVFAAAVLLVAWAASAGYAQMKIATPEDYDKTMKAIGGAMGATNKAIASGSLADAKTSLATARSNMMAVQAFWMERKKDDPAMIAKDALARMDTADKALSGTDAAAAGMAVKEIFGTCQACHMKYRDPDPNTPKSFIFKPGVL